MANYKKTSYKGVSFKNILVENEEPIKRNNHYYWKCKCLLCGKHFYIRDDIVKQKKQKCCFECSSNDEIKLKKLHDGTNRQNGTQEDKIGKKTISNISSVVGVNWDKSRGKWQSSIRFQGKKYNLGRFEDFKEATEARKKAEDEIFKIINDNKKAHQSR